tara:strand:- start:2458 stop:3297 length:840 start_codon:yes stop_codon:yes gene_type:complete
MIDATSVAGVLTDRFGLPLRGVAHASSEGERCRVFPDDIDLTQGFAIEVLIGWRSVEVAFVPGNFAAGLVAGMQSAGPQQRAAFHAFARAIQSDGATLVFQLNGVSADPLADQEWPANWQSLAMNLQRSPVAIDHNEARQIDQVAALWGGRMLGLALSLLPIEEKANGEEEGALIRAEVNRYERSAINRAACIEIHGAVCKACGFDFGAHYGEVGVGFIEVHHLEPVSGIAPGTVVDPDSDLVPLCSNCHAMVHRRTPPYTVEDVRAMLRFGCTDHADG